MGSFAGWELQKAIVSRLESDSATSSYTVTDNKDASYPYIAVGEMTDVELSSADTDGSEAMVTIHVWALNSKDAQTIMADVDTALKNGVMSLSGHKQLRIPMRESAETIKDFDAEAGREVRHGTIEYLFMTHES